MSAGTGHAHPPDAARTDPPDAAPAAPPDAAFTDLPDAAGAGTPGERPVLRVVTGDATPEEIAAVVAAVTAATTEESGAEAAGGEEGTTSIWSVPGHGHHRVRATFTPGPNAWRTSFWPH